MAIQSLTTTVIRPEDLLAVQLELVDADLPPPQPGQPAAPTVPRRRCRADGAAPTAARRRRSAPARDLVAR